MMRTVTVKISDEEYDFLNALNYFSMGDVTISMVLRKGLEIWIEKYKHDFPEATESVNQLILMRKDETTSEE